MEFKRRDLPEREMVPIEDVLEAVTATLNALQTELDATVVDVPYNV